MQIPTISIKYLQSIAIFSVPSKGLIIPGTSSPNDKWSILWEKLYAEAKNKIN